MVCQKCFLTIDCKTDVFTVCEGSCSRSFHAECVGLSEDSVSCCLKKNIIWLCNDCLSAFYDHIQKKILGLPEPENVPSKVDAELADIKGKIANMMDAITVISETQKKSYQHIPRHSTPNRSPKLHEGSKSDNHSPSEHSLSTMSTDSVRRHYQDTEGTFSLFLTNIDGRVTEKEISSMVSRSLGVEENEVIHVKKLVPKWQVNDALDYVSFKVQLHDNLKLIALREDSWPTGVMYREFIERPRNIWKPTGCGTIST